MLGVFLVCLGILAYLRIAYAKRLDRLAVGLVRIQLLRQIMAEEIVFTQRPTMLLFLNFILLLALFIIGMLNVLSPTDTNSFDLGAFGVLSLIIAAIYAGKFILGAVMRWLFNDRGLIREYLFETMIIQCALGIILIPTLALLLFSVGSDRHIILQIAFIFLALAWLYRILQGLRLSMAYPVSWVYIILYLCTLEILPLLALLKGSQMAIFLG